MTSLFLSLAGAGCGGPHTHAAPSLSPAQIAGQHVVFPFAGRRPPPDLVRRIRRGEAAGVVLFGRNLGTRHELARLTARLQRIPQPEATRRPLLIMIDQEGGPVRRLLGPPTQSAAEIGRLRPARAREQGHSTGAFLRGLGVNVNLAPVVDTGRPGSALEQEQRIFSRDVAAVTAHGDAFASGLGETGVAATFKHFPGLGDARHNTDNGRTVIRLPLETLRTIDERPFAAANHSGLRLVMVSLAIYPAIDPAPAALSTAVVRGELRGVAHFGGVSITDSLDTPATARYGGPDELGIRSARAGIDLLLFGRSYGGAARAADALTAALRRGALDRGQLLAGSERVLRLRGQLPR